MLFLLYEREFTDAWSYNALSGDPAVLDQAQALRIAAGVARANFLTMLSATLAKRKRGNAAPAGVDLVARLRADHCAAGCAPDTCLCVLAEEAADEIERLRKAIPRPRGHDTLPFRKIFWLIAGGMVAFLIATVVIAALAPR